MNHLCSRIASMGKRLVRGQPWTGTPCLCLVLHISGVRLHGPLNCKLQTCAPTCKPAHPCTAILSTRCNCDACGKNKKALSLLRPPATHANDIRKA